MNRSLERGDVHDHFFLRANRKTLVLKELLGADLDEFSQNLEPQRFIGKFFECNELASEGSQYGKRGVRTPLAALDRLNMLPF
jgi:hypothetical protein